MMGEWPERLGASHEMRTDVEVTGLTTGFPGMPGGPVEKTAGEEKLKTAGEEELETLNEYYILKVARKQRSPPLPPIQKPKIICCLWRQGRRIST